MTSVAKEPRCQLCSGMLSKESNVWMQTGGTNTLCYSLAWVCNDCGATWPIGLAGGGLFKSWNPLWANGKRSE
jgi:hypothetical protein